MLPHVALRTALATAVSVVLLVPAAAGAATVAKSDSCDDEFGLCGSQVTYSAAPGEKNDVAIKYDSSGSVLVSDAGAPLTTVGTCVRIDEHNARCDPAQGSRGGNLSYTFADTGDGDDRLVLEVPGSAEGGPGSDFIDATAADYSDRKVPLTVDLVAGTVTAAGETDSLSARVTDVVAGQRDDVVRGSDRDENLSGGSGDDTISGGGGDDDISGRKGRDVLDGGPGDDRVGGQDPGRDAVDRVRCGDGNDIAGGLDGDAAYTDPVDLVAADCERLTLPSIGEVGTAVKVSRGALVLAVPGDPCDCTGKLVVRSSSGRLLAAGRSRGGRHRLSVPLTRAGRKLLAGGARRTLVLTWTAGRERAGYTTRVGGAG